MVKTMVLVFVAAMLGRAAMLYAQLPECYREVDHVIWVVGDLKSVVKGWKSMGFSGIREINYITLKEERKPAIRAKAAVANLGGLKVFWLEADKMGGVLKTFHDAHGDAILALVHAAGGSEMEREINRLKDKGLDGGFIADFNTNLGDLHYYFAGTRPEGKYEIAVCSRNTGDALFSRIAGGENEHGLTFNQYAFAIRDPAPVSQFWAGLGFPEMEITHPEVHDKAYFGRAAEFAMDLGWQRHGRIVYEWCIPLSGPTVYEDHIKARGEGVQHFGFNADNLDGVVSAWRSLGLRGSQSGGWGEKGKPGSGRFYYVDTTKFGGLTVELLWNYRE
jgi:methylmalonyl-CoA/ethylmalonyl-CoA epimerase